MDSESKDKEFPGVIPLAIAVLGSLRLTVALLGMAIFIVFAGTVAQIDQGIWTVVAKYFRCWFTWVDCRIFLPRDWNVGGGFPFPGGWLIGAALLVNLVVSHSVRIQVKARGPRLAVGSGILAIGAALTWMVISHVFDADSSERTISPTWRVTLQLLEGGGAAAALFAGCRMLFVRKAGIVLLHAGIVLMMFHELFTGLYAEEASMTIGEGQQVGYVEDSRHAELAILDTSRPESDEVWAVPESSLARGHLIKDASLPFDIEPVGPFMKNAGLKRTGDGAPNRATAGTGLEWRAVEVSEASGVDTSAGVDLPAAYVTFKDKQTGAALGTWLASVQQTINNVREKVAAGGKTYEVCLRFKRTYKPYEIYLYDFRFERYPGTETPKDYSSYVKLVDRERGIERDVRIWMNNPLRYRGDTLYQSSFDKATEATTVLQVVDNESWMVPYVSCMIVAVGMLGQFGLSLLGFLRKRAAA